MSDRKLNLTHDEAVSILGIHDDMPLTTILLLSAQMIEVVSDMLPPTYEGTEIKNTCIELIQANKEKAKQVRNIINVKSFN